MSLSVKRWPRARNTTDLLTFFPRRSRSSISKVDQFVPLIVANVAYVTLGAERRLVGCLSLKLE